jgi:hypothetical protein
MTESTNNENLLFGDVSELSTAQFSVSRIEKTVPDAYRLVGHRTDNGFTELRLQGYFTWEQGWSAGGSWKDIDTVDADDLSDDKPYGQLY